jgi:hypothetical protein
MPSGLISRADFLKIGASKRQLCCVRYIRGAAPLRYNIFWIRNMLGDAAVNFRASFVYVLFDLETQKVLRQFL